jgi:hypothetical protein
MTFLEAAQHRLHLTAFGAVRGGHLAKKVFFGSVVSFKPAAGEPHRWACKNTDGNMRK